MNDSEIIALFFERSEQAIAELDRRYGSYVRSVLKNILNDPQDAEECVNDTYWTIWNVIPPNRPEYLGAFVCGVARNVGIARFRANIARKRNSSYNIALDELEAILHSPADVEAEIDARELSSYINQFLGTQSALDRFVFVRRYWYGDPVSDIAADAKISPHAVSVRLFRVRNRLKKYLRKEGLVV